MTFTFNPLEQFEINTPLLHDSNTYTLINFLPSIFFSLEFFIFILFFLLLKLPHIWKFWWPNSFCISLVLIFLYLIFNFLFNFYLIFFISYFLFNFFQISYFFWKNNLISYYSPEMESIVDVKLQILISADSLERQISEHFKPILGDEVIVIRYIGSIVNFFIVSLTTDLLIIFFYFIKCTSSPILSLQTKIKEIKKIVNFENYYQKNSTFSYITYFLGFVSAFISCFVEVAYFIDRPE